MFGSIQSMEGTLTSILQGLANRPDRLEKAWVQSISLTNRSQATVEELNRLGTAFDDPVFRRASYKLQEAIECLSYATESSEYGRLDSATTDLSRAQKLLAEAKDSLLHNSPIPYRSWILNPIRNWPRPLTRN